MPAPHLHLLPEYSLAQFHLFEILRTQFEILLRWRCFWHYQEVNLTLNISSISPYRFQEFARSRLCRKNPEDLYDIAAVKRYMFGAGSEYQQKEF